MQYQFNSFCLQFDDVDALKITDKKLPKKMLWNKEEKHGLEFKGTQSADAHVH